MRLSALLPLALCVTSLTAQHGFSDEQRAELRQLLREEIRAALKELHSGQTQAVVASPKGMHAGPVRLDVVEAKPDGAMAAAKDGHGGSKAWVLHADGKAAKVIHLGDNDLAFDVKTDADAKVAKLVKKAAKGQMVELLDVTEGGPRTQGGDAKGITFQFEGGKLLHLGGKDAKVFTTGGDEGGQNKQPKVFTFSIDGKVDGKNVVQLDSKSAEACEGEACCEEGGAKGACCEVVIEGGSATKAEKAEKAAKAEKAERKGTKDKKDKKGKKKNKQGKKAEVGKQISFGAMPAAGTLRVVGAAK
ncbi:MAG: hypothetical protein ABIP94_15580 [Planctomycetota bacterium]